ncbi:MAG TPA: thiamine pyrophosphate-requiring protein [Burkholderiales bacterium]|nr:thiamine pyrophosphate-requiring protein [Burkholderiales bacterium]
MQANSSATAAQRLLELSTRLGVKYIFSNLGSDHPAFIEAFARLRERGGAMPEVIVCPHEMTALSAAHGYTMITGRPQLVLVHVDVGTQNLGGSIHNAARARVPAIIVAGLSPVTSGKRVGSRNEFIHYVQDTPRQHEIVGQYMKWCYELRAAEMVDEVLLRAMQIAATSPTGPVYITGAREIWEEAVPDFGESEADWPPSQLGGLPEEAVAELYRALVQAQRPIVITSYLGRQHRAVERLVSLSEQVGIGVCEVSPHQWVNFPGDHPNHLTYRRNAVVEEADLILMIDVDVPWLSSKVQPAQGTKVFHIDVDPVKDKLSFWHFPAQRTYQADSLRALDQLLAEGQDSEAKGRGARREWIASVKQRLSSPMTASSAGAITPEELTSAVRELVTDRTIVIFEEPSSTEIIPGILKMRQPGSYFSSGGAGLGWAINAAVGAKLARPEAEVITLVGDGCYVFGVPSSAYWVASTYRAPHLTIIYNNGGWHSPKLSTLGVHPEGTAKRNDTYWVTIGSGARLADIATAAAKGIEAFRVGERESLKETLGRAMQVVRNGQSAVVDVAITPISAQVLAE